MALSTAAASSSSRSEPPSLQVALQEFEDGLTVERRAHWQSLRSNPDVDSVMAYTAQLDRDNAQRRRRCVASRFCRLLQSIQQYAAVMDTYSQVNADVTSLVWGSVKLTIHVASGAASYFDNLSEMFMVLGTSCPRYAEYAALFPQSPDLQKALDAYYATVIRFCSKAVAVMERPALVQFATALWKPFDVEFGSFKADLKRLNRDVNEAIRLASTKSVHEYQSSGMRFRNIMTEWRQKDSERQVILEKQNSIAEKQRLLDRVSNFDYQNALLRNRKKRHGTTCGWLSQRETYMQWLQDPESAVFLLSGDIGTGKTVLAAATVNDLLCRNFPDSTRVCYYFCEESHAKSLSATTIIGSLLRQCLTLDTLTGRAATEVRNLFANGEPELDQWISLFKIASKQALTHYVILDGVEECTQDVQRAVLRVLGRLPSTADQASRFKLFITCRGDVSRIVPATFKSTYRQSVSQTTIEADLAAFVQDTLQQKIADGDLAVGSEELVAEISRTLVSQADGMFLWVVFQLHDVCDQICDADIRRVLRTLPKGMAQTYERILQRVAQHGKPDVAGKVFRWVSAVKRPLSLSELGEAISVKLGQTSFQHELLVQGITRLATWCGNQVSVDEESQEVRFAHHSVKQFLCAAISGPCGYPPEFFHFQLADADAEVGDICVTYLSFSDFERQLATIPPPRRPAISPLAMVGASLTSGLKPGIAKPLHRLQGLWQHSRPVEVASAPWSSTGGLSHTPSLEQQYSLLSYAREFWLVHTCQFVPSSPVAPLWQNLVHKNVAMAGGDATEIAKFIVEHRHYALLRHLARHRWEDSPSDLDCLLTAVAERPSESFAATPSESPRPQITVEYSLTAAQSQAAIGWHISKVTGLISDVTDIEARVDELTLLQLAARVGLLSAVLRLLDEGADVNAKPARRNGRTALQAAAEGGHRFMVDLLLEKSADVNAAPGRDGGRTALQAAAEQGHILVVETLLNAKAKVNAPPAVRNGRTALHAAAERGHTKVVKALLAAPKIDVNVAANADGKRTALQAAAEGGHYDAVSFLLAAKANADAAPAPEGGRTALQAAAERGHVDVVKILLYKKADVNAAPASTDGRTALQAAAEHGHENVVRLLLKANADVNAAPASRGGCTALGGAKKNGHDEICSLLIQAGAVE